MLNELGRGGGGEPKGATRRNSQETTSIMRVASDNMMRRVVMGIDAQGNDKSSRKT
jgi:hypothetical protein